VSRRTWIPMLFICAALSAEAQTISTIAGSNWVFPAAPLQAVKAPLGRVTGVAVDKAGNYYVADLENNLVLKVNASGTLSIVAGNGGVGYSGDGGPATSATLHDLQGMAGTGPNGISSYSGDGGPATTAELNLPSGVAVDGAGNLYVADMGNNRIRKVSPARASSPRWLATVLTAIPETAAQPPAPGYPSRKGWRLTQPATCSLPTRATCESAK
jgi:hypothetical protein